ncbi:MAG: SurA N-terminal domain-containing protein [Leptospiraceae bacterium]|nr:SurA N-terminal domain-containing protein [Leptospiraceae bacterium]MDW8305767.1 SurA N-terminal domain-containing protein [Leptospiraceae bacterium]
MLFCFFVLLSTPLAAWEILNEVVAVVGNEPITYIDLQNEMKNFKARKFTKKEDQRNLESQVLDLLIGRQIVELVAQEESITVSPERVEQMLQKEMEIRQVSSKEELRKLIEKETGLSFEDYKKELARQIKTQQVIQLRVTVPNPTSNQIEEWYRLNKNKLGKKYIFRMVAMPFRRDNELQVSKLMSQAHSEVRKKKNSFAQVAAKYSQHPSKNRGGLMGPYRLDEIARMDTVLAAAVNNTPVGQLSQVFVGNGYYYFIQVEATKDISLDEIYEQVRSLLYSQNEQLAFLDWVQKERKRVAVTIYLKQYQEP